MKPEQLAAAKRLANGSAPAALRMIADGRENGCELDEDPEVTSAAAEVLFESRVDLVAIITGGIPEPAYVPGCAPWLRAAKRYLSPAPAGSGKSLAWAVVAVTVVEAGGKVVILDVENGADEYARRLSDILRARDTDGTLTEAVRERLHYHAWPRLSLAWPAEEWGGAVDGADLVIFDSSRMALTSVGLGEDKADDYARFAGHLLMPLSKASTATVTLDNTGHENKDRARGTITKEDLNEVVYKLVVGAPFDRDRTGNVRLIRRRTRFAELPREIRIELGGGIYAKPEVVTEPVDEHGERQFRPTRLMERLSRAIEAQPGQTQNGLLESVTGNRDGKISALKTLEREEYIELRPDGQARRHHSIEPYREITDERA